MRSHSTIKSIGAPRRLHRLAGVILFLLTAAFAAAQNTNGPATIAKTASKKT